MFMIKAILCDGRKMRLMIYAVILLIGCSPIMAQEDNKDIAAVMRTLKLNPDNCPKELMAKKTLPNMDGHTVYVILENTEKESADFFVFDCHIVIREDATGKTAYSFHEKGAWESDAIAVNRVEIDTAPYKVSDGQRAFGVRVSVANNSRVVDQVPYGNYQINKLYIISNQTPFYGESGGQVGDIGIIKNDNFIATVSDTKKILMMSGAKTNGYFNIIVKSAITTSINKWVNDDCVAEDKASRATQTLRFVDGEYK